MDVNAPTTRRQTLDPSAFDPLREQFAGLLEQRPGIGAALAVWHDGIPVVDVWGGSNGWSVDQTGGGTREGRWDERTATVLFSSTKGLVSIIVAQLVAEGRLGYEDLVSDHWPEFAAAGKDRTRVRHLLTHQAGLPAPRESLTREQVLAWHPIVTALQNQQPFWEPGVGHEYHALTWGWLVGELIRRVTGRTVGEELAARLAAPMNADVWLGLPATLPGKAGPHVGLQATTIRTGTSEYGDSVQVARMGYDPAEPDQPPLDLQEVPWGEHVLTLGRALPPDLIGADGGLNDLETQRAEFPAVGAIGTARALAAIWSATVVDTQGVRLLPPELVSAATKVQSEGAPISGIPFYLRWGMGFELSSDPHPMLTDASFGHAGYGGQLAFADPRHRVGFAFVTNQLLRGADNRASGLVDTLRRILTSAADPVV